MALTVVNAPYRQQRTPFWERVGTELLIPALSDLWKTHRQNEQNRKQNTMRGEFEKRKKALENMGQDSGSMGQSNGGFMNTPQMPEGYNSNAWANAFHNTDTPLTQFDMGTADILPPSAQSIQQAQQRKVLSPAEQRSIINELAGMYRFSNVSPDAIENLFAPDLKAAEEAYKRSQRDEAAQAYANAADALGKRDSAMEYAIRGITPENIAKMADDFYRYENPYYQGSVVNTGGQQQAIRFNPRTGEYTTGLTFDNTLTPQQVQAGRQWKSDFEATRTDADRNYGLKEQELELKKRPKIHSIGRGDDGVMYMYFDDGSKQAVTPDTAGLSTIETQQVASLEASRKDLVTRYKDLTTALSKAATDEERAPIVEGINKIATEIKGIDSQISSIYDGKLNSTPTAEGKKLPTTTLGTNNDIVLNMIGGKGTISSPYGIERTKKDGTTYSHKGIDIALANGSEILAPGLGGLPLKVTKVANDPKGYGNYVDLEAVHKGFIVGIRIGHMQDGSINVKEGSALTPGDLIGLVGNTGNSRGKNGGYHMHVEVTINGKHIDPSKLSEFINAHLAEQRTKQQRNVVQSAAGQGTNAGNANADTGANALPQGNVGQGDVIINNQSQQQQNNYASVMNNPESNWTPNYQHVNMPAAYTAMNIPMIEPSQPQQAQPQPAQGSTQANTGSFRNSINPFSATPADGEEIPATVQQGQQVDAGQNTQTQPQISAQSTLANNTTRYDPDDGLTKYRAEGDNSPVTWRDNRGKPARLPNGQLFTQQTYEELAREVDAGEYRDMNINNHSDLNNWLESLGLHKDTPAEQRGVNNLNGNSNANLPPENEDTNVTPATPTPQNSPEKYPAPEFTDMLNGTTESDTQDLLNGLNGITDRRYANWTDALRRYYPETLSSSSPTFSNATPAQTIQQTSPAVNEELAPPLSPNDYDLDYDLSDAELVAGRGGGVRKGAKIRKRGRAVPRRAPQQVVPQQAVPKKVKTKKVVSAPRKGYTSYEQQRTHVDGASKRHGVETALIRAVIEQESSWNPKATGPKTKWGQAKGLMQLMSATAKEMGVLDPYDPAQNIEGGTRYLAKMLKRYNGDVSKALMAYNSGPKWVDKGKVPAAARKYASEVMARYQRIKGQG